MKQAYWDLDLILLSTESAAFHLDREFILIDNFNETDEQTYPDLEFVNHPAKLSFSIMLFCLTGRMRFQYTVQQIADMLNFANQSFFGKYFKGKVGCSPTEYQK